MLDDGETIEGDGREAWVGVIAFPVVVGDEPDRFEGHERPSLVPDSLKADTGVSTLLNRFLDCCRFISCFAVAVASLLVMVAAMTLDLDIIMPDKCCCC